MESRWGATTTITGEEDDDHDEDGDFTSREPPEKGSFCLVLPFSNFCFFGTF